jgi:hypothetical protein
MHHHRSNSSRDRSSSRKAIGEVQRMTIRRRNKKWAKLDLKTLPDQEPSEYTSNAPYLFDVVLADTESYDASPALSIPGLHVNDTPRHDYHELFERYSEHLTTDAVMNEPEMTEFDFVGREFPSLGAPTQQGQQNAPAAQNLWANAPIRTTVSQTQQQQVVQRIGGGTSASQQQSTQDDVSRILGAADAYRFGNLGTLGAQPQSGSDEFPPLGGLGVGHERGGLLGGLNAPSGLSHLGPDQAAAELAYRSGLGDRNV